MDYTCSCYQVYSTFVKFQCPFCLSVTELTSSNIEHILEHIFVFFGTLNTCPIYSKHAESVNFLQISQNLRTSFLFLKHIRLTYLRNFKTLHLSGTWVRMFAFRHKKHIHILNLFEILNIHLIFLKP